MGEPKDMPGSKKLGPKGPAQVRDPETGAGSPGLRVIDITGRSMRPLLRDGCKVVVGPVRSQVALGDILLFRRDSAVIVHRVVRLKRRGTDVLIRTKGDGTTRLDPGWIKQTDAIAKVVGLVRGARVVDLESRLWRCLGRLLAVGSYAMGLTGEAIRNQAGVRGPGVTKGDNHSGD